MNNVSCGGPNYAHFIYKETKPSKVKLQVQRHKLEAEQDRGLILLELFARLRHLGFTESWGQGVGGDVTMGADTSVISGMHHEHISNSLLSLLWEWGVWGRIFTSCCSADYSIISGIHI